MSGPVRLSVVIPAMNGQVIELHRTGKLRILAVATPERLSGAPEIPTAAEAGVAVGVSGHTGISWSTGCRACAL